MGPVRTSSFLLGKQLLLCGPPGPLQARDEASAQAYGQHSLQGPPDTESLLLGFLQENL